MIMKIYKQLALASLLVWTATGCVDLNYSEVTTNNEEWIYKSPLYGIQQLVTSVYAHIPNGFDKNYEGGSGATLAAASDEADCSISNSSVHRFYNGAWSPNNAFGFTWDNSYRAIAEANNFLAKLDKISLKDYESNSDYEAMKQKFELFPYEVRFLRAYFYFELVRAYGNVPFTLRVLTPAEANAMVLTKATTIMDWIVNEMDAIAEFLPITYATELNTDFGRATRPMCLALKARTLLYRASALFNPTNDKSLWLKAAQANYDVIKFATKWGIKLDNYASIWGPDNGDGTEVIMASKQGALNSWEKYNYPIGVENGMGGMCPTQTLVDAYEYSDGSGQTFGEKYSKNDINLTEAHPYDGLDPRFAMTVVKNGDLWPNYNKIPVETFEGGANGLPLTNATETGYYLKKYCDGNVNISTNDATTTPHAWILMRLGEFYLNFAEAAYEYSGDADNAGEFGLTPNGAINELRDREDVKMPHWSGNPANWMEKYRRERMVELAFENHRFWDVRRWKEGNALASVKIAKITKDSKGILHMTRATKQRNWNDHYYFFPIPYSEVNKNAALMNENDGWGMAN